MSIKVELVNMKKTTFNLKNEKQLYKYQILYHNEQMLISITINK